MSNVIWSPDGTRVAARTPARPERPQRVVVFDVRKTWTGQIPGALPLSMPEGVNVFPTSWSADGRQLALNAIGPDASAGIYIYDFETRQVQKVSRLGEIQSVARWLSDNRRLLVAYRGRLHLINTVAAKSHEVLSVWPDAIGGHSVSRDDRLIVYGLRSRRSDIWLASAEERPTGRRQ